MQLRLTIMRKGTGANPKSRGRKMTTTIAFVACVTILLGGLFATTEQTILPPKFFSAVFLQYVGEDDQTQIYAPNMDDNDQTSLRVINQTILYPEYIAAAKNISGSAGVTFKSSKAIIDNAKHVKDLGFDFIAFNLERGISPSSDYNNVVSAMKTAADAAHAHELKFRAVPSRSFTIEYGSQIAPYVDYYHIQAQYFQDNGIKAYSDYVHAQVAELKSANPNLIVSVQVSTRQGDTPGLSLLETMQQCVDSVIHVVDGVSVWFGGDDLDTLRSFVEWYNNKYA